MQGLRTQESKKFERFWQLVQDRAQKDGYVFFGECGEGRDFETEEIEGEDFFGWLIPCALQNDFQKQWEQNRVNKRWNKFCRFAVWSETDTGIKISFRKI